MAPAPSAPAFTSKRTRNRIIHSSVRVETVNYNMRGPTVLSTV